MSKSQKSHANICENRPYNFAEVIQTTLKAHRQEDRQVSANRTMAFRELLLCA